MGSRVHYVLVRDGIAVKSGRGGGHGLSLDVQLAAGPDEVVRWIEVMAAGDDVQPGVGGPAGWSRDTVCDGAVLLDVDDGYWRNRMSPAICPATPARAADAECRTR